MLQRSRKVGFFPDAWVFPGGRVDADDAHLQTRGSVHGLPATDHAFAVAAIRECFEETGVWLGEGAPPVSLRHALIRREAGLLSQPGIVADLGTLELWSWWVTPETEPRRYDTRFFLSVIPDGLRPDAEPDGHETVASRWCTAADALVASERGDLFLAPPTFRTLEELAGFDSISTVRRVARSRTVRAIQPLLRRDLPDCDGWGIILPGDPEHPDQQPVEGATRILLQGGRWVSLSPQG